MRVSACELELVWCILCCSTKGRDIHAFFTHPNVEQNGKENWWDSEAISGQKMKSDC